jgi:HSP20 family molecular chaperone IbpA
MPTEEEFASERFCDVDMEEGDNEVTVRAELPGFDPNDLDVQVNNDLLTIKAEKKQEEKAEEGRGRRSERRYAMYRRTITLPPGTNPEKAEANYRNGVLELHFARSPGAKGKRIPIHGEGQAHKVLSQKPEAQQKTTTEGQTAATTSSARSAK